MRSLKEDFSDGLKLIALLELLSGGTVQSYNKNPRFTCHKMDNVGTLKSVQEGLSAVV